jgi:hypothetical protein
VETLAETFKPASSLAPSPPSSAGATASPPATRGKTGIGAADATSEPKLPKKTSGNRRWLIKQRDGDWKVKPSKSEPIKWASSRQQTQCEALLPTLRENFDKARYYSIQGDSCKTAAHANRFLDTYRICESQCPADYLKGLGYRDLIPRNMRRLVELGKGRCQDRPKTVKSDASRGASPTP